MPDLTGKVAIITGARRGMGRTHSLELAKAGAKIVVSDISEEDCQKVVEEIRKEGSEAIAIKCDVSKKKEVDEMVKKTVATFGKVDILVNNAGILQSKPFLELVEEDWDKMLDVNLKGCFLCAQAAAREMVKQKSGAIINIASIAAGQIGVGFANIVHYCASKGGIVALTEALAVELSQFNIRVNVVSPGAIDTPMVEASKADPKAMEATLARIPLHRMGDPEEVSKTVLFLASDDSSYITGANIVVDGGYISS